MEILAQSLCETVFTPTTFRHTKRLPIRISNPSPPIKMFTIICREIQIAKIWIYYLVLHHCKTQGFLKPFTAHTSDLLELTNLSNKFDGHNQGKPDNFPHFCSRAKTTVFQTHTSDLHRFCSNRLVRRTKTQSVEPLRFKQLIRDP
jgi:hypothetical protein